MSLTINSNMLSTAVRRSMGKVQNRIAQSVTRLSSGLRINSAADDAAGLAISTKMDAHVRSLHQAVRNTNDSISLVQIGEQALGEMNTILQRMRELSIHASTETLSDQDRNSISAEYNHLSTEIDRIAGVTEFNGYKLFDGTTATHSIQVGLDAQNTIDISVQEVTAEILGLESEFRINTSETGSSQAFLSIGALNDGGFVVTWQNYGQDGSDYGIYGQRFDASGLRNGDEFLINTYTANNQSEPFVTSLNDGGFLVTWYSDGQDGSDNGIYGQRYDVSGNTVGNEFQINTYTLSSQMTPSVTDLSDGGFMVAWQSDGQDGSDYGIYGQRFDSSGNKSGSEFQINTYTSSAQSNAFVSDLGDGFVVVWQSNGQDGSGYGIYGQRFDSGSNTVGSEFRINTYTTDTQSGPFVSALSDGGFVVTWNSAGQDGEAFGVFGQKYDANGNTVGSEFQANTYTSEAQAVSSTSALDDGGFAVTWMSRNQDGTLWSIYGQRYDSNSNRLGNEFKLNTSEVSQVRPVSTSLSDGSYVAVWETWGSEYNIDGQRFDSNGNKVDYSSLSTITTARSSIARIDNAMVLVSQMSANLGAVHNRLESIVNSQEMQIENLSASSSRIKDADYADETAVMAKNLIIQQAAVSVLAQANMQSEIVLQLLNT